MNISKRTHLHLRELEATARTTISSIPEENGANWGLHAASSSSQEGQPTKNNVRSVQVDHSYTVQGKIIHVGVDAGDTSIRDSLWQRR